MAGKAWKQEKYRRILEEGFRLFSERGIERVTSAEVAEASGVSRATLFRYFPSKQELVIAISVWKWENYIENYQASVHVKKMGEMTGAESLRRFLDSFVELYRSHGEILRFNYDFNSYLQYEASSPEQRQPYRNMVDRLGAQFHALYERGMNDGTLRSDIPEADMFSSAFHIMLAAATRYAMGLVVVYEDAVDPYGELVMLEELLLSRFTNG